MIETKKPFPQFIDKNPKKHFHWSLFIVIAIALAAALLISIQNFKTAEEIDSMAPVPNKIKVDVSRQKVVEAASSTVGNIEDWKNYINKDYGFEIKYPMDGYVYKTYENGTYSNPAAENVRIQNSGKEYYIIQIGIFDHKKDQSIEFLCDPLPGAEVISNNGFTGYNYSPDKYGDTVQTSFCLKGKGYDIKVSFYTKTNNIELGKNIFSSFKFTE